MTHWEVTGLHTLPIDRIVRLVGAAESESEHPLGRAIHKYAVDTLPESQLPLPACIDFEALPGMGLVCVVGEVRVWVGNRRLMASVGTAVEPSTESALREREARAETAMLVAVSATGTEADAVVEAVVAVADPVKPEAATVVKTLQLMGIATMMLTGDNSATAAAIAKTVGIAHVMAEVMPTDKVAKVKLLQAEGRVVAMVGGSVSCFQPWGFQRLKKAVKHRLGLNRARPLVKSLPK